MMRANVFVAVALLASAFDTPAQAQNPGRIAPPRSADEADVVDWVQTNFPDDELVFVGWSEGGAYLLDRRTLRLTKDGMVRTWIKGENFAPQKTKGIGVVRSTNTLHEIDCQGGRTQMLARDYYGQNNLLGDRLYGADLDSGWTHVRPNTMQQLISDEVCAYVREAAEMPAEGAPASAATAR